MIGCRPMAKRTIERGANANKTHEIDWSREILITYCNLMSIQRGFFKNSPAKNMEIFAARCISVNVCSVEE